MRELKILNKNYEVANLYTVVYEGYTIKEIIEDSPVFSVTPPQHYLYYWQKVYDYFKTGTKVPGYTYLPQGQSKYDVAYVNKTIDDPIAELNGHTLREVFEEGNIADISDFSVSVRVSLEIINGELKITATDNLSGYVSTSNIYLNSVYYTRYSIKNVDAISGGRIANVIVHDSGTLVDTINSNYLGTTYEDFSKISDYTNLSGVTTAISRYYSSHDTIGQISYLKDYYTIDLLEFGISPTIDMDYYYSLYQARKNITKKVLTYADIFEGMNMLNNSEFETQSMDNLDTQSGSLEITDGQGILTDNNTVNYVRLLLTALDYNANDKLYFNSRVKWDSKTSSMQWYLYDNSESALFNSVIKTPITEFQIYSGIRNALHDYNTGTRFGGTVTSLPCKHIYDYVYFLNIEGQFDENMTLELLDAHLLHYRSVRKIVIYPEIYVPTDPTGFGNRYAFRELNKKVYGHELDFENMQLNLLFGVYKNAYDSYNQLMNFIIGNEGIISYDYGKGVRYSDIRLIKSPKTELDDGRYLKEKFDFKRLTPFYTLEQGSSLTIKNTHDWDLKLVVSGTVNTNIVYIEAEETTSGLTKTVKFDFTAVTKPFNLYYNSETKQILINGINNGYQYIDFTQGISFISLPKDTEHLIWTTGITNPAITVKKWVID